MFIECQADSALPITGQVHAYLRHEFPTVSCCVDATAGNGHDTMFLASLAGEKGLVHAFDIQNEALVVTRQRLADQELLEAVTLHHACHSQMERYIPENWQGRVDVVMFNLGYLPCALKSVTTLTETTLRALEASLRIIRSGGCLSVVAYPGHQAGAIESEAVGDWFQGNRIHFTDYCVKEAKSGSKGPVWHCAINN